MQFKAIITFVTLTGLVAASPRSTTTQCATLCIDAINDCGIPYGDCYAVCSPELSPTPPPCPSTASPYPDPTITLD
ncbi:hypothetical protein FSARC_6940 [Fusarium sarcochroum]|uniref:Uncharacterized protein n=1 Tax=Fusarium sarcochroum TaxID=1208366 RepID=A0A8H4X8V0_9HYPO|nr:hypothetical protein FSARC_6940 [Fusarium sarcochroum]